MANESRWTSWVGLSAVLAAVLLGISFPVPVLGQSGNPTYVGRVSYSASDAVEVSGHRGIFTSESTITSDGRSVGRGSVLPGMIAELEVDPEGRVVELRVTGVVE